MNRRQRTLLWGATLAAVLSTGGLGASAWVRSPAEAAADTGPPTPTVLTARVVYQRLTSATVFRGTFTARGTVSFTPRAPLAPDGTAASGNGADTAVVTAVKARTGQRVRAGKVLVEVGYRPVVALPGRVPALRDLAEGDTGPDVAELQHALGESGYGHGTDRTGTFGSGTAAAVGRLYAAIGYPVPTRPSGGRKKAVMMPASEVMFVPSFPATVTRLDGGVGEKAGTPLITLATNGLRLRGRLDPAFEGVVKAGQSVKVFDETLATTYKGRIDTVGRLVTPGAGGDGRSAESDAGAPYLPVDTSPASGPWDVRLLGEDVRITAYAQVSHGGVLAVPEGALTTTAGGIASVTVVGPGGRERRVEVTPGASADGLVAVDPAAGQALAAGDRVVVGER
ncbi:hypothetical protein [Streptomyces sp. NPDC048710]|uniref:hypothetical protein n=1 Tax=Streptomyces sp. NPDC048710 TaxID=3365586 RepID=UPI00371FF626